MALERTTLNDQVYETLRERVLRRQPGPGAKVSLHELASELGVSRSPVHHALTRLVSEGLLTVKPRRGYYVAPVTPAMVRDGYDVRLALELHAAERSVGAVDRRELARFRELAAETDVATTEEEWDSANAAFHAFQIDLAHNRVLSHLYRELPVNLVLQLVRGGRLENADVLSREHLTIVGAYETSDLLAARAAIAAHIDFGVRFALDVVEQAGGVL